jgi:hypothetical protein
MALCYLRAVVKEVVGKIIADIPKNSSAENSCCHIPVPVEDCMSQFVEWSCKGNEKSRRHNQSELVHGQVMVNSVE